MQPQAAQWLQPGTNLHRLATGEGETLTVELPFWATTRDGRTGRVMRPSGTTERVRLLRR